MRVWLAFSAWLAGCLWAAPAAFAQDQALRGTVPDMVASAPRPMNFKLGRFAGSPACGLPCAEFIYAQGEIRPDSVEALMILQSRLKRPLPVIFHSPGGNLDGGLALGRLIRREGADTRVASLTALDCGRAANCSEADKRGGITVFAEQSAEGHCNSSCVYAFSGGVRRSVAQGASLGVHQFFLARSDDPYRRPLAQYGKADAAKLDRAHEVIASYLTEMGVNIDTLRLAASVDPHDIRRLTPAEATALNLTTPAFAPAPRAVSVAPPLDPITTGSLRPVVLPQESLPSEPWPVVTRAGKPFLIAALSTESRRFGAITAEVAIGCPQNAGRYDLAFREIIRNRPQAGQDARIRIAPDDAPEMQAHAPALAREVALRADKMGVLVLEVTSSATSGYPTRIEVPGFGLKSAIEKLDRACTQS